MEKMSFLFLIIIICYLTIVFLKRKKTNDLTPQKVLEEKELLKNKNDYDEKIMPAVVAALACAMGNNPYVLKRVYISGEVDEKKSSWRIAARNENTTKRNFFK